MVSVIVDLAARRSGPSAVLGSTAVLRKSLCTDRAPQEERGTCALVTLQMNIDDMNLKPVNAVKVLFRVIHDDPAFYRLA